MYLACAKGVRESKDAVNSQLSANGNQLSSSTPSCEPATSPKTPLTVSLTVVLSVMEPSPVLATVALATSASRIS